MARRPLTPPVRAVDKEGAHRLIPALYSEGGTVLAELAADDDMLEKLVRLDGATNDRIQGEHSGLVGISPYELVYGVLNAHIVRAAFLHPAPSGSRFNDSTRGAWYAAWELETSLAEVSYHKARRLAEMVVPDAPAGVPQQEHSLYDDWMADFRAEFHVLSPASDYRDDLEREPVPACYAASQHLARLLLAEQSNGIVYPSVRRSRGRCIVCFRPALVYRPRRGGRYQITFLWDNEAYRYTVQQISVKS